MRKEGGDRERSGGRESVGQEEEWTSGEVGMGEGGEERTVWARPGDEQTRLGMRGSGRGRN